MPFSFKASWLSWSLLFFLNGIVVPIFLHQNTSLAQNGIQKYYSPRISISVGSDKIYTFIPGILSWNIISPNWGGKVGNRLDGSLQTSQKCENVVTWWECKMRMLNTVHTDTDNVSTSCLAAILWCVLVRQIILHFFEGIQPVPVYLVTVNVKYCGHVDTNGLVPTGHAGWTCLSASNIHFTSAGVH